MGLEAVLQSRIGTLLQSEIESNSAPTESNPEILFGLNVRSDSLPDDVIAQINQFWQQQQFREALSLFYRASLAKLLHRFYLPFSDDMTEGECAQLVAENTRFEITEFFSS